MPLSNNILTAGGIGPVTLHDVYVAGLPNVPALPHSLWMIITFIGILSGGLLLVQLVSSILCILNSPSDLRSKNDRIIIIFLLLSSLIYFIPIAVSGFFDRYLIPLIPILCTAIAVSIRSLRSHQQTFTVVMVLLFICIYSLFSIASTRDYLTLNRTRWEALRNLMEHDSIVPSKIDGGFEFNGWYLYDQNYSPTMHKSWWWVHDDLYMVTMGPINGYEVVRKYPFQYCMPPLEANIFVLRRDNDMNILINAEKRRIKH